jgi:hypothetical protein
MMIYSVETKHGDGKDASGKPLREDGQTVHTMVFDDGDWLDGHLRPEVLAQIPPEDRARLEAAMKQAHDAMEKSREWRKDVHPLTAEEQRKIHDQVDAAMKQAHDAMVQVRVAQNDGRVLMRCKVGADGKASDCVKAFPGEGPVRQFWLQRIGPDGKPLPPMGGPLPPMPGAAPFPPPPPAPPAPPGERG